MANVTPPSNKAAARPIHANLVMIFSKAICPSKEHPTGIGGSSNSAMNGYGAASPLPTSLDSRRTRQLLCRDRQCRQKLAYVYFEEEPGVSLFSDFNSSDDNACCGLIKSAKVWASRTARNASVALRR